MQITNKNKPRHTKAEAGVRHGSKLPRVEVPKDSSVGTFIPTIRATGWMVWTTMPDHNIRSSIRWYSILRIHLLYLSV